MQRGRVHTRALFCKEECVCETEMFCPQKKVRKCELERMRSKDKPPKQNSMMNEEKEGMKEEREKSTEEHEEEENDTF